MDESSRMTVEKKKSQVNPVIPDSKYQFPLRCQYISLDASAEHLVINQDDTVRLMISSDSVVTVVQVLFQRV